MVERFVVEGFSLIKLDEIAPANRCHEVEDCIGLVLRFFHAKDKLLTFRYFVAVFDQSNDKFGPAHDRVRVHRACVLSKLNRQFWTFAYTQEQIGKVVSTIAATARIHQIDQVNLSATLLNP